MKRIQSRYNKRGSKDRKQSYISYKLNNIYIKINHHNDHKLLETTYDDCDEYNLNKCINCKKLTYNTICKNCTSKCSYCNSSSTKLVTMRCQILYCDMYTCHNCYKKYGCEKCSYILCNLHNTHNYITNYIYMPNDILNNINIYIPRLCWFCKHKNYRDINHFNYHNAHYDLNIKLPEYYTNMYY